MKISTNVLNGYLTEDCKNCISWGDGTQPEYGYAIGCCISVPIDWCESFAKMMRTRKPGDPDIEIEEP